MGRLLAYLLFVSALIAGGAWLLDHPGSVVLEWLGWRMATTMPAFLLLLAIGVALVWGAVAIVVGALRLPHGLTKARREKRRHKGYLALTDGLAAVAAGQADLAKRLFQRAQTLLADPALTRLLAAQTAKLEGDLKGAEAHFRAMLGRAETRVLGLKGLLERALSLGDHPAALDYARQAFSAHPKDAGLADSLFTLQVQAGRLDEALKTLDEAVRTGAVERADAQRRRALVYNDQAAAEDHRDRATGLLRRALAADPGLADAALRLAGWLAEQGDERGAARLLERTWSHRPDRALAVAYADLGGKEESLARLRRFEKLVDGAPDDVEAHLLLGEAALAARVWGLARKHLTDAVGLRPTALPYRLLARLETEEHGDEAAARHWQDLAHGAARDPVWQCQRCFHVAEHWQTLCPHCRAVDSLAWHSPTAAAEASPPLRLDNEHANFPPSVAEIAQR